MLWTRRMMMNILHSWMGVSILGDEDSEDLLPTIASICYVAGPYTAAIPYEIDQHILNAEKLSLALIDWGFTVLTPHKNNSNYERYESILDVDNSYWIASDLAILTRCDYICMLPDWKKSEGAQVEHKHAQQAIIPILYSEFNDA
jgi:hypothetical protein